MGGECNETSLFISVSNQLHNLIVGQNAEVTRYSSILSLNLWDSELNRGDK